MRFMLAPLIVLYEKISVQYPGKCFYFYFLFLFRSFHISFSSLMTGFYAFLLRSCLIFWSLVLFHNNIFLLPSFLTLSSFSACLFLLISFRIFFSDLFCSYFLSIINQVTTSLLPNNVNNNVLNINQNERKYI